MVQFTPVVLEVQPTEVLQRGERKGVLNPLHQIAVLAVDLQYRLRSLHDDVSEKASRLRGTPDECAFLVRRIEARGDIREAIDRQVNFRTSASQDPPHFNRFQVKREAVNRRGAVQTRHTVKHVGKSIRAVAHEVLPLRRAVLDNAGRPAASAQFPTERETIGHSAPPGDRLRIRYSAGADGTPRIRHRQRRRPPRTARRQHRPDLISEFGHDRPISRLPRCCTAGGQVLVASPFEVVGRPVPYRIGVFALDDARCLQLPPEYR
ncbi:hypothetical protein SCOCK_100189 [Actinacidiphila cocklensis]|uniref:Uncharacterized protein n=1 Tax=Actinacidiphila cocklensis TaxID=887465 RepID=A0A9W4GNA2_9ACTN|nr:hypothetical protein SCOCK_100189 [Actinacidiphila cocklensis]